MVVVVVVVAGIPVAEIVEGHDEVSVAAAGVSEVIGAVFQQALAGGTLDVNVLKVFVGDGFLLERFGSRSLETRLATRTHRPALQQTVHRN